MAILVALALGARAWQPGRLGLGHYDEGVYATSARGLLDPADRHLFPGQERFSPPVWFVGVAAASRLTGVTPGEAAIGLNLLIGTATVLVAGLLAWGWFGSLAGVSTAALLAASQFQVMLDRTALTDPSFALAMLLAVAALGRGMARGSLAWCLGGGILTGVAWNTKYHGWFVLVVCGLALAAAWWAGRKGNDPGLDARRALGGWLVAGVVAGLMYLPWALYIGRTSGGGWGALFDYYLGMIGTQWLDNAGRHLAMQAYLDGPLTRGSVLLALAAGVFVGPDRLRGSAVALAALVGAAAWFTGGGPLVLGLAVVGAASLMHGRPRFPAWLLLSWVGLWIIAAPVYHPYARLLLPVAVALAILAGTGIDRVVRWCRSDASRGVPRNLAGACLMTLAVFIVVSGGRADLGPAATWAENGDTRHAAGSVAAQVPPERPIIVIGEPALAYYLQELGRPARELVESIGTLEAHDAETWVVAGVYAERAPALRDGLAALGPRLVAVGRIPFVPADLRLLDDLPPAEAERYRLAPDHRFDFRLYRLSPAEGSP